MPRLARTLLILLAATARLGAEEPLPTDPRLVTGELENGLRYVILPHAQPPGRATAWIHISSGSLNETDRQRGIAHYLEHMAFNGSTSFPPGSLVPFFQSLGMTFGRDQNAFTNMDQTTYQLSLPDAKPETLTKGMTFFADVLTGLLLQPKEIDAERQIILEERRRGLSGRQRVRDQVMQKLAPGTIWSLRDTIGTEETIRGVVEKDFRDYYGKWYLASNATVLVVADTDPAEVAKAIQAAFAAAPKRPRPVPQDPGVRAFTKPFAVLASDPEIDTEEVRLTRLAPPEPPATTVERWRDRLLLSLAETAFNRRMEDKIARGGMSFLRARADSGNEGTGVHTTELSARPLPGKWKEALAGAALELQRARKFGFTAREIEDAKRERLSAAERDAETEATTMAQTLIRRLNTSLVTGEPMMSPEQRVELLRKTLPTIQPEEASKRFAAEYSTAAMAFVLTLPTAPAMPTEAELLEAGLLAVAAEPKPEAEVARATQLLAELPKPGEWKEQQDHATGIWTGYLSNGVCVHHKFLDTQKRQVSVEIALVGGEILETAANRGITSGALVAWRTAAAKSVSSSDIRELMTGRKVSVRAGGEGAPGGRRGGRGGGDAGVGGGAISLSVSGSPDDLETGFQLAYLLLTEPKVEAAPFQQFQIGALQSLAETLRNPLSLGMRLVSAAPFPEDDARLQPTSAEQIEKLTAEASQAWIEKLVRVSPVEVTIVGDLPRERALELAARYLGSLPARDRVAPDSLRAQRTVQRPDGPRRVERTLTTPTPQAFVLSGFYGPDESNRPDYRAMNMAARVLSTRMFAELREKAQLVYSIGASQRPVGAYPGFGILAAAAPTEPQKATALADGIAALYAAFAASGPTEEEMTVARKQFAVLFEEQMKDPGYWMTRMNLMAFRGLKADDIAGDPAAYQALTAQQVKDVFARYYAPKNAVLVVVTPKG